jgi:hypothetical protein
MNRPTKYRAWANGKMHDVRAIALPRAARFIAYEEDINPDDIPF